MNAKLGAAVGKHAGNVFAEHFGKNPGLESVRFISYIITTVDEDILFAAVTVEVTVQNYLPLSGQSESRKERQRN